MIARRIMSISKEAAAPVSGYQRSITVDNTSNANTLTDYQVRIDLEWSSNMRRDFGDLRFFANNDGTSALDYWIENIIEAERAIIWVQVAEITGSSSETIYMRYGQGETSTTSNDANTMIVGADFKDATTTGLTLNTAGSGTLTVPTITSEEMNGVRVDGFSKYPSNPVIAVGAGGQWDDAALRDFTIVSDDNGYPIEFGDGLWGYYGGFDGAEWAIGLVKSTDNGYTWTKYGSNPVLSESGVGSSWYETGVFQPSVIKDGSTYYMMAHGEDGSGTDSMGVFSSSDGLSWTDEGQKLTLSDFDDGGTASTQMGVPSMIKRADGTWLCLLECLNPGTARAWRIYGATASDPTGTWTPLNSGQPLLGAGSGWEGQGVANPDIIETSAGNYLLMYNGLEVISGAWAIGFATSSNLTSWTKYSGNPVIDLGSSGAFDDIDLETSHLLKEPDSDYLRVYYQGFADGTLAQIGIALAPQTRFLKGLSAANADGWIAGYDMDSVGQFQSEFVTQNTADSSAVDSQFRMGLFDFASVPSPSTAGNERFYAFRFDPNSSQPNKFVVAYQNTSNAFRFWNGTSWTATFSAAVAFGDTQGGIYKVIIRDDGTNYYADIVSYPDGTSVFATQPSIAKSSVRTFANGRVLFAGEMLTSAWYMGQNLHSMVIREYDSPEPSTSVGSESSF